MTTQSPAADNTQPLNNYVISVIRTGVPYVVGAVCAVAASKGLNIPAADQAQVDPILAAGLGTAYYAAVHAAEKRWPKVGALIGWVATIHYTKGG